MVRRIHSRLTVERLVAYEDRLELLSIESVQALACMLVDHSAVFSPFVQDDFVFATNFRGPVLGVLYQAARQIDLHGWILVAKPDRSASAALRQNQWRLRLDATIGFPR